jgi:hypothetical protein
METLGVEAGRRLGTEIHCCIAWAVLRGAPHHGARRSFRITTSAPTIAIAANANHWIA